MEWTTTDLKVITNSNLINFYFKYDWNVKDKNSNKTKKNKAH